MGAVPRSYWLIVEPAALSVAALILTIACLRFALRTKSRPAWLMTLSAFAIAIMGAWSAVNMTLHVWSDGIGHYIMAQIPYWLLESAQIGIGTGLFFFALNMPAPAAAITRRCAPFIMAFVLVPLAFCAMWLDLLIGLFSGELSLCIGAVLLFRCRRNSGTFVILLGALSGFVLQLMCYLMPIHGNILVLVLTSPNAMVAWSLVILSFGLFLFAR